MRIYDLKNLDVQIWWSWYYVKIRKINKLSSAETPHAMFSILSVSLPDTFSQAQSYMLIRMKAYDHSLL